MNESCNRMHGNFCDFDWLRFGVILSFGKACTHFFYFILKDGPKVAFLAIMEASPSVSLGSTILFDTVRTNVGSGYNVDDGIFTTPYDGIYQFSASMLTGQNGEIWAYFSLNGKRIASIYAHGTETRHDQGANIVILQLYKGDRVCVVNHQASTIWGNGYSTFSGNLL